MTPERRFRNAQDLTDDAAPPQVQAEANDADPGDLGAATRASAAQGLELVQRKSEGALAVDDEAHVVAAAAAGMEGPAAPLPYREQLEAAFGRDLSQIQVHTGDQAAQGNEQMGATAYATGNHIVLGASPDLHTVAHEVAHTLQQQAGVHPKLAVGPVDDPLEAEADQIADKVVAGESVEHLIPQCPACAASDSDEPCRCAMTGGDGPVQQYTEKKLGGKPARVSDGGRAAVLGKSNYSQDLYATEDLIDEANAALAASGDKGSYLTLVKTGKSLDTGTHTLEHVKPVFDPKGDGANKDLATANAGKDETDTMSLWADCGRSSRAVMGSLGDQAPHATYSTGKTEKETGASYKPATYSDKIYLDAMPKFLRDPAAKNFLVEGVHVQGDAPIDAVDADQARAQYWELGEEGRRVFDRYAGINTGANPEVGGAYTMNTEYNMPGFKEQGAMTWNFHWAGVVMKDGGDNVTLENYADGNGYESINMDWNYQMYGTAKKGQTFQEQHLDSGTHANRASSFAVEPEGS